MVPPVNSGATRPGRFTPHPAGARDCPTTRQAASTGGSSPVRAARPYQWALDFGVRARVA